MQENDEKRIERTVVWLDAKLVPRMDGWLAADNCKNRSEFINKALRFYMGYLGTEDNTAYLYRFDRIFTKHRRSGYCSA